jgi:hypothetical protein
MFNIARGCAVLSLSSRISIPRFNLGSAFSGGFVFKVFSKKVSPAAAP